MSIVISYLHLLIIRGIKMLNINSILLASVLTSVLLVWSSASTANQNSNLSHGGGTDECGCHTKSKTGEYHCHTRKKRGGSCPA